MKDLLKERPQLFRLPGENLRATHLVTHRIELTSNVPIKVKRYRHPPEIKAQMQKEIDKFLKADVIEPSESPYSSPMWIVEKGPDVEGNVRWRLLTDFRQLNGITVGNSYPSPITTDIIDSVANARYITVIDWKSGFYQIPMHPADAAKTAFSGSHGHYQYKRLGMGLKDAPSTFQGLMDLVLAGLQGLELYVYLDDIVVFAEDLEEHVTRFRRLMKRLDDANLTVKPAKCQFLQTEAGFLGHIAGNERIRDLREWTLRK